MPTREQMTKRAIAIEKYLDENPDKRGIKNRFSEQFSIVEMECKNAILENWHSKKKYLNRASIEDITLNFGLIKNALGPDSEYDFTEDFLLRIFGGGKNKSNPYKTRGTMSAKILRDEIFHELKMVAIDELCKRESEIFGLLSNFRETYERKDVETT